MSTTSYQTTAKPRGRRGSQGDPEKSGRSRASSSASANLAKTLSRTLDEASIHRNNRPSSPAIYPARPRPADARPSNAAAASARQYSVPSTTDANVQRRQGDSTPLTLISHVQPKTAVVHNPYDDVHNFEVSDSIPRPMSPPKTVCQHLPEIPDSTSLPPLVQQVSTHHVPEGLGRRTQSSRSLASMQPTVVEEPEDTMTGQNAAPQDPSKVVSPQKIDMIPDSLSNSLVFEEPVVFSPETSKSSLRDTAASVIPLSSTSLLQEGAASLLHRTSTPSQYYRSETPAARTSISSLNETLVAPIPQGFATFMQMGPDSGSVDPSERGVLVATNPSPPAEASAHQEVARQAHSPAGSPPLSPFIHQQRSSPPPHPLYYAPPYHFQSPQLFMSSPQFPPSFYSPTFASPPIGSGYPASIARTDSARHEDERSRLLEKVSNVLPDLNRLLLYYQENQGLPAGNHDLVRQADSQQTEEINRLKFELSACREEYEKIIGEQASENLRLRRDLAEQAEKSVLVNEVTQSGSEGDNEPDQLKQKYESLMQEVDIAQFRNNELEAEKKLLETEILALQDQICEERARHEQIHMESRQAHESDMLVKEEEHVRHVQEHKLGISKIQLDLAGMITKHTQQKKELDSARATISEHEQTLIDRNRDLAHIKHIFEEELDKTRQALEEQGKQHKQEVALWSQEILNLIAKHKNELDQTAEAHQQQLDNVRKESEQQLSDARRDRERMEAEKVAELEKRHNELVLVQQALDEELNLRHSLQKQLGTAKDAHEALKIRREQQNRHHLGLETGMMKLKSIQAEWQRESEKMERFLQEMKRLEVDKFENDEVLSMPGMYR